MASTADRSPLTPTILTINAGSSSLKFAGFTADLPPRHQVRGEVQSLGTAQARLTSNQGGSISDQAIGPTREDAVAAVLRMVGEVGSWEGIGHRIVHPGMRLAGHQQITPGVRQQLAAAIELDPAHLPLALAAIDALQRAYPRVPQVACLDTAFHHDLPRVSQLLPLPRRWQVVGLRRLGFHGLSFAFLMQELERLDGPAAAQGRVVLAHLGSGASLAAVRAGCCQDTTMGFTPLAGLVMGSRPGDLDPGVVAYLASQEQLDGAALRTLLSTQCGLTGISGGISDMRQLQARRASDGAAADAVDLFTHQARRCLGAMVMAAGGLDTLVFAGGIGEHDALVRAAICADLGFLGLDIDPAANAAHHALISSTSSRVRVRVIRTDEEQMMASIVRSLCQLSPIPEPTP